MIRDLIARGFGFHDGTRFIPTLGLGHAVTASAAPPGPGRPQYMWTESSKRKKCRKRIQQALILNDFDFVEAQREVHCT